MSYPGVTILSHQPHLPVRLSVVIVFILLFLNKFKQV